MKKQKYKEYIKLQRSKKFTTKRKHFSLNNAMKRPVKNPKGNTSELGMQFPVSSGQLHRISPPTPVPKPKAAVVSAPVPVPNPVRFIPAAAPKRAQNQNWAAKQQIGQFSGSTGAQILSPAELTTGYLPWTRKDHMFNTAPVTGGMGMHLLQKLGWKPGEGLGKEKTGSLEPLLLEIKLDKKGFVANDEVKKKPVKMPGGKHPALGKFTVKNKTQKNAVTPAEKHPVMLLGEYAIKNELGVPQYECCLESGPSHKPNFLFKVRLSGIEYQANAAWPTKKQAKSDAATVCLQQLGLINNYQVYN